MTSSTEAQCTDFDTSDQQFTHAHTSACQKQQQFVPTTCTAAAAAATAAQHTCSEGQSCEQCHAPVDPVAVLFVRAELHHHDEVGAVPSGGQCASTRQRFVSAAGTNRRQVSTMRGN